MKKVVLLFVLLISGMVSNVFATEPEPKIGSITGKVIDNKQQGIAYAAIVIKSIEGETITGGITTEDGNFEIDKLPEGSFILEVQFIGYKTVSREVNLVSGSLKQNLGTISLTA